MGQVALPLRNQAVLDELLRDLSYPESPRYRHFLTPQQFNEQFGPTEADYQALLDYARASGFTINDIDPGRKLVSFHAPAAAVEKAFNVKLKRYRHPKEARDFFAPDAEPTLDLAVPVQDIGGLDDYVVPHPMNLVIEPESQASQTTNAPVPLSGSGPGGSSYTGNDFRTAYAPGVTLTGAGQYVGMVQFGGYIRSDIEHWENAYEGGSHVPIYDVLLDTVTNITDGVTSEGALDIELQIAMAPGISGIYYYYGVSIDTILARIASDNVTRQVSASWDYNGTSSTDALWRQLAAQGITFFNASGDSGAEPNILSRSCSSSSITLAGGTTLTMSGTAVTKGMTITASAPRYLALLGAGDGEVRGAISVNGGVAKLGAGTWTLTGSSPMGGPTVINNGTLVVNGSLTSSANNVTDAGGTLAGNGVIAGPVTVQAAGTLAPGSSVGKLTINNTLTLQGTAVMEIARNGTVLTNDLVAGITTLTYGGTLIVTNVGSSPLQVGDTFQLFAANSRGGAFANIIYPAGYLFSNSLSVNGQVKVLTVPVTTPPNFPPGGLTQLGDGTISMTVTGELGVPYRLWASTNLALTPVTNLWTLLTNGTISTTPFTIIDSAATNFPRRFYLFSSP